ncbi:MAG: universal stress protein [Bacteroidales bacterium]|nr:universal stress protein [Bacteroidales bacterium]
MKKKIIQFIRSADNLNEVSGFAVNYAKKMDLDIHLLMVMETRHAYFYPMTSPLKSDLAAYEFEQIREERQLREQADMDKYVNEQNEIKGNPHFSFEIVNGATDLVLTEISRNEDTSFILINESQEPENGFIINTYLNILENAECPVLKIPQYTGITDIKKILYATDYREEDLPTLSKLSEIASIFSARITALHITDSVDLEEKLLSHGFETSVKEKVGYEGLEFTIHEDKDIIEGILTFSHKGNFDLIVLLKENRSFLKRIFTSSDSNKILSKSDIPVMIYHEKK